MKRWPTHSPHFVSLLKRKRMQIKLPEYVVFSVSVGKPQHYLTGFSFHISEDSISSGESMSQGTIPSLKMVPLLKRPESPATEIKGADGTTATDATGDLV